MHTLFVFTLTVAKIFYFKNLETVGYLNIECTIYVRANRYVDDLLCTCLTLLRRKYGGVFECFYTLRLSYATRKGQY